MPHVPTLAKLSRLSCAAAPLLASQCCLLSHDWTPVVGLSLPAEARQQQAVSYAGSVGMSPRPQAGSTTDFPKRTEHDIKYHHVKVCLCKSALGENGRMSGGGGWQLMLDSRRRLLLRRRRLVERRRRWGRRVCSKRANSDKSMSLRCCERPNHITAAPQHVRCDHVHSTAFGPKERHVVCWTKS